MSDPRLPPIVQPPLGSHDSLRDVAPAVESSSSDASDSALESGGISGNRPLVFAILFGVTGVIGLPLLWFSPAFTRKEKWLWSIVNTLYTLGLVAIAIASLKVIFDAMQQL